MMRTWCHARSRGFVGARSIRSVQLYQVKSVVIQPGGRSWRSGAEVLHGPRHHLFELARRAQRPVRIAQQLARQEYAVGPALSDDAVRLPGFRDETDGPRRHARLAADALRKSDLIARRHGNDSVRNGAAGRAVDQVDTERAQPARQLHRLLDIPAALLPIGAGQPDEDRQLLGPYGADRPHDLEAQAHAIVVGASVLVGARVDERRQKL